MSAPKWLVFYDGDESVPPTLCDSEAMIAECRDRAFRVMKKAVGVMAVPVRQALAAPEMAEALERCITLLDATARFMSKNGLAAELTIDYDEAECDGLCLKDDCRSARDYAHDALDKAKGVTK